MPAFLYKPRNSSGKLPVVVIWHGGPGKPEPAHLLPVRAGCWLPSGDRGAAAERARLVRIREGLPRADDGPRREQALGDIQATLDWIATQPELGRVAHRRVRRQLWRLLTLATAAFQSGRVRAAVDVVASRTWSPSWRTRRPTGATCAARSTVTSATQRSVQCRSASRRCSACGRSRRSSSSSRATTTRGPAQRGEQIVKRCVPAQGRLVPARDERRARLREEGKPRLRYCCDRSFLPAEVAGAGQDE